MSPSQSAAGNRLGLVGEPQHSSADPEMVALNLEQLCDVLGAAMDAADPHTLVRLFVIAQKLGAVADKHGLVSVSGDTPR